VKSRIATTLTLAMTLAFTCAFAPSTSHAQNIFDQQSQPEAAVPAPTSRYKPTDSFDQIRSDVDRDAKNATSPSPHIVYSNASDGVVASPPSSRVNAPTVASATGMAAVFANYFPTSGGRAGISKYLSIIQPQSYTSDHDIRTSNTGMAAWFDKELGGNACLQRRAVDFYTAVGKITEQVESPTSGLSRNVQSESQGRLKPGWLWRMAMRSSGGDSGLALTLIGMCGHDDKAQGGVKDAPFTFRDDSAAARSVIDYKIARYNEIRTDLLAQVRQPTVQSKALLGNLDRELFSLKRAHPFTSLACPNRPSIFFASESLGKGVDISDELKAEIETAQNPDHVLDLPSKYYHVYSGAFLACQMIEAGMNPRAARAVAAEGAKIYRGIRLCETLTTATIGWSPEGYRTPEDFLSSRDLASKCSNAAFVKSNSGLCAFANQAFYYRNSIRDPNELRRKITGIVSTADASVLYRRWFLGGVAKTLGGHLACTDTQIMGPKNLLAPETDGSPDNTGIEMGALFKPRSWSNARYEAAKQKLATWMIDSKWTIAQHTVGADFAAKNCKPRSSDESLEQAACRIDGAKTPAKRAGAVQ
jgi:hypothetical protein